MEASAAGRRVLLLARHFPPIGGAGVQRSAGYARHLPDYGLRPVVVTGPGSSADPWSPPDPALLDELPVRTEVHRLAGPEPAAHRGVRAAAERRLQRPPPWVRWWVEGAVAKGLEAGGAADLVLASCVPYETALAGARVSRLLGVPWVADLEDPWALDEMRVHPTALHRRRDLAAMRRALSSASAIVTCAPEAAARIERAFPEHSGRVAAIPIGFEPGDFLGPAPERPDGAFRIVHTGSLHTELGLAHRRSARLRRALGGSSLDADLLTRSVVFLIEALERLARAEPRLGDRLELHLAGELTEADLDAVAGRLFVRAVGRLPHRETVELMRSADLLFLPMHELPPGRRAGLIPYKTYEYLAARRPILAAVPDGDVRDMLAPLAHVSLCRPSDVDAMASAVRARMQRPPAPAEEPEPPAALDRRALVGSAAALMQEAMGTAARAAEAVPAA
jgi:glycosyltransferase involved in cell wall biosynthesis